MIDKAVKEQIGKPNLKAAVRTLQSRDSRFEHLTHQRLSDWRDKTQKDKIVWSQKTLAQVQKGFLPGGDHTHFNVFVSFSHTTHRNFTNSKNSTITLTYLLKSKSHWLHFVHPLSALILCQSVV
jgi:hypothetical protein